MHMQYMSLCSEACLFTGSLKLVSFSFKCLVLSTCPVLKYSTDMSTDIVDMTVLCGRLVLDSAALTLKAINIWSDDHITSAFQSVGPMPEQQIRSKVAVQTT